MKMKKYLVLVLMILMNLSAFPAGKRSNLYNRIAEKAQTALKNKDYRVYELCYKKLLSLNPNHPHLLYDSAVALVLNGKNDLALAYLKRVLVSESTRILRLKTDERFNSLSLSSVFQSILQRAEALIKPFGQSRIAYTIREKDLIPEGVAFDPVTETLFVSSIYKRKIVAISKNGRIRDFKPSKADGLLATIGMQVDAGRRHLWVCSGWYGGSEILDIGVEKDRKSKLFKYDIDSGKLIKIYMTPGDHPGFLNDITLRSDGTVYMTDTKTHEIFHISPGNDKIEVYIDNEQIMYPNGITISDDDDHLFIAHYGGMVVVDTRTRKQKTMAYPEGIFPGHIDGLAYYKNRLIAHQGTVFGGLIMYTLNSTRDRIIGKRKLDILNPLFSMPTTGEIAGDRYFYIANAQIRSFNQSGKIWSLDKLKPVRILELNLDQKNCR